MISTPQNVTSHLEMIELQDLNPGYSFPYVGVKHNIRSLMCTLSPHLFCKGGILPGEKLIDEHAQILFSHEKITKLLLVFSQDDKESSLLRGAASLLMADAANPAKLYHQMRLHRDVVSNCLPDQNERLSDASMRCYLAAIDCLEKYEALHFVSVKGEASLPRPSSVAKNNALSLLAELPLPTQKGHVTTIKRVLKLFFHAINDRYWPVTYTMMHFAQQRGLRTSFQGNDSAFLLTIVAKNTEDPGLLEKSDSVRLAKIWTRLKKDYLSSLRLDLRGQKREAEAVNDAKVKTRKREAHDDQRVAKLKEKISCLETENKELLSLCEKLSAELEKRLEAESL